MANTDSPILTLIREATLLKRNYSQGHAKLKLGTLRWTGDIRPSEISNSYLVDLRYKPPWSPRVFVRHPRLTTDADGNLPHIYPDGSLCLHEPGQWSHGDPIAKTILPWTCEWLLHYEFWLATGEWSGSGGSHTGPIRAATKPPCHRSRRGGRTKGRRRRPSLATPRVKVED